MLTGGTPVQRRETCVSARPLAIGSTEPVAALRSGTHLLAQCREGPPEIREGSMKTEVLGYNRRRAWGAR